MGGKVIERAPAMGTGTASATASAPATACVSKQMATWQRVQEGQTSQPAAPWTPSLNVLQRSVAPISSLAVSESAAAIEALPD